MLNKKVLLSLGALVAFAGCQAETRMVLNRESELSANDQFLKKMNVDLNTQIDRTKLDFKVDGKTVETEYWVMSKDQFASFKKLVECSVTGLKIASDENNAELQYLVFTDELGFEQNVHFAGVKKAGIVDKIKIFIRTKDYTVFLKDAWVHVADDSYTHVAIKADLQIREFKVAGVDSRVYRNVPAESQIGNLPGIYLRGNGKTTQKGDLVGFSYRAEKDGSVADYIFGELYKEAATN